jgi:hypothetical protein
MDGFSYFDIFATKGIEYLVVIVFLGMFILFARALTDGSRKRDEQRGRKPEAR